MFPILSEKESKQLQVQREAERMKAETAENLMIQKQTQNPSLKKVKLSELLTAHDKEENVTGQMAAVYVQEFENQPAQLRSFQDLVWNTAQIMRDTDGDVLGVPICAGG